MKNGLTPAGGKGMRKATILPPYPLPPQTPQPHTHHAGVLTHASVDKGFYLLFIFFDLEGMEGAELYSITLTVGSEGTGTEECGGEGESEE